MRGLKIAYESVPWKDVGPGVRYKPVVVNGLGASLVSFDAASSHPPHSHEETQLVFCLEGNIEFYVKDDAGERSERLGPGDVLALEPGVMHGTVTTEPVLLLTIWNPMNRFAADSVFV